MAGRGDDNAITYLQRRATRAKSGHISSLYKHCGGKQQAIQNVRQHFDAVLAPSELNSDVESIHQELQNKAAHREAVLFTLEEVAEYCQSKLELNKTSGPSGISNEFVLVLIQDPVGAVLLLNFFNDLLCGSEPPVELFVSQVILIPKVTSVVEPQQLRPINLQEVLLKIFCGLLFKRLKTSWMRGVKHQYGGLPGCQSLDALYAAHSFVRHESLTQQFSIWISLDVRGAFDHLTHCAVGNFMLKRTDDDSVVEAHRLFQVIRRSLLRFSVDDGSWEVLPTRGVVQGGSHSGIVFSLVVDQTIQDVFQTWLSSGIHSGHGIYGWEYVDDAIFPASNDWATAAAQFDDLVQALGKVGLYINFDKTKIFSAPHVLAEGRAMQWDDGRDICKCQWVSTLNYLRKPLAHASLYQAGEVDPLLRTAQATIHSTWKSMRSIYKYANWSSHRLLLSSLHRRVATRWLWFSPLILPLQRNIEFCHVMQISLVVEALKLYIPSNVGFDVAMSLHQIRRRLSKMLIFLTDTVWSRSWLRRAWSYIGHVIRQPMSHVAAVAFWEPLLLAG